MAARNDTLKDRLSRYQEINISVTGRKSGRTISIPVWFVLEDVKLYLLPVLRLFPDASLCGLFPLALTFGLCPVIEQHGFDALTLLPVVSFVFILAAAILAVVPYEQRRGSGYGVHEASMRSCNYYARTIALLSTK